MTQREINEHDWKIGETVYYMWEDDETQNEIYNKIKHWVYIPIIKKGTVKEISPFEFNPAITLIKLDFTGDALVGQVVFKSSVPSEYDDCETDKAFTYEELVPTLKKKQKEAEKQLQSLKKRQEKKLAKLQTLIGDIDDYIELVNLMKI